MGEAVQEIVRVLVLRYRLAVKSDDAERVKRIDALIEGLEAEFPEATGKDSANV